MSASACPVSMLAFNRANGTPPSSPTSIRNRVQDSANPRPSSPTIRVRSPMTLPSIATTTCGSPSSPNMTRSFVGAFKCTSGPIAQRRNAQVAPPMVSNASSNLSVSSNDREQPMATCPVATCPVAEKPVPGGKRKLGKGCSLLDWIRLCRNKKGELGAPGGEKRPVTLAELAEHSTEDDAWTAIRGMLISLLHVLWQCLLMVHCIECKCHLAPLALLIHVCPNIAAWCQHCCVQLLAGKVYNITHYIRFHPGGKEDLMKGAGKDCSILFDEVREITQTPN